MRSSRRGVRIIVVLGIALFMGSAMAPTVFAEPDTVQADQVAGPAAAGDIDPAATSACSTFADALDKAAIFYGDFADTIDGTARPDYADPTVSTTNVSGRTALRESAGQAMKAAGTAGLSPDIANPIRSWSVDATKLLLKMGLRGGGDTLNTTATEMNNDANTAQMACAAAGTHA